MAPYELLRIRICAFSKGFFNLKHPSLHPHILLLDCFPTEQLKPVLVSACVYIAARHPHLHTSLSCRYFFHVSYSSRVDIAGKLKAPKTVLSSLLRQYTVAYWKKKGRAPAPAPLLRAGPSSKCAPGWGIIGPSGQPEASNSSFSGILVEFPLFPNRWVSAGACSRKGSAQLWWRTSFFAGRWLGHSWVCLWSNLLLSNPTPAKPDKVWVETPLPVS